MQARGVSTVVECGPGKALAGMVKRISPELAALNLLDPASLAEVKAALAV
jgi:[acyl-carrier-protein] S-malonyltransferase